MNPFKFGTVVDTPFFTNRTEELAELKRLLKGHNHIIMISPRRFGKTSLIQKVLKEREGKALFVDLQLANGVEDLAAQLLKRLYRLYPMQRMRDGLKGFRIMPGIALDPLSGEVEVTFQAQQDTLPLLEDVFNLAEKLSHAEKRLVVVLDEFQDIRKLDKNLGKNLRAILQYHKKVNYVFLGSQESMMKSIFEKKKSPFYHFGLLFPLEKIHAKDFKSYLNAGFKKHTTNGSLLSEQVLAFTDGHPYYTQQLAFVTYNLLLQGHKGKWVVRDAIAENIQIHDYDYERLWLGFNNTDKKLITALSQTNKEPLSTAFLQKHQLKAASTVYSSLKRLMHQGFIIKSEKYYEIDDPFFKHWLIERRRR